MAWEVIGEDEVAAVASLHKDSDRAVAIVAASIVERRLEQVLFTALKDDRAVRGSMFHSSGPLGSFAAKIQLAYLLGFVSQSFFKDLGRMKTIRNRFAHDLTAMTFEEPSIRANCLNFQIVDEISREVGDLGRQGTRNMLMAVKNREIELRKPRRRYLLSATIFSSALLNHSPGPLRTPWL